MDRGYSNDPGTHTFWWCLDGPFRQYVNGEGSARIRNDHAEQFEGQTIKLGVWIMLLAP
jgi:hypothetical protein